jgi:hypothetical protein
MNKHKSPNLSNSEILKRQTAIAYAFRKKWNNLMATLLFAIWFSIGLPSTLNYFYPGWDAEIRYAALAAAAMIISIAFLIYRMYAYKCPNCKHIPQGEYWSFSGKVHYGKGINLIPKVCRSCGSFLSLRAIRKACAAQKS